MKWGSVREKGFLRILFVILSLLYFAGVLTFLCLIGKSSCRQSSVPPFSSRQDSTPAAPTPAHIP